MTNRIEYKLLRGTSRFPHIGNDCLNICIIRLEYLINKNEKITVIRSERYIADPSTSYLCIHIPRKDVKTYNVYVHNGRDFINKRIKLFQNVQKIKKRIKLFHSIYPE